MRGDPVRLRIVVQEPPAGVLFSLQDAHNRPVDARLSDGGDLTFELELRCDLSGGGPNFLGTFARGTPTARFVYVASGAQAGEVGTCWDRRAKLLLADIGVDQVRRALDGALLTAVIPGRMKDGGPVCASVRPVTGWQISSDPAGGTPPLPARSARRSTAPRTSGTSPSEG